MRLALEPPNQQDVAALVAALDDYSAGLYPPESRFPVAIERLAQPNVLFAVARDRNGKAIGCGAVVVCPEFGEIKRMFVRPEERGRGVGKAMLLFLEAEAARTGCTLLRLETGVKQPEALALYERCGFKRRGPFASYPDDPLCVFMEKVLKLAASTNYGRRRPRLKSQSWRRSDLPNLATPIFCVAWAILAATRSHVPRGWFDIVLAYSLSGAAMMEVSKSFGWHEAEEKAMWARNSYLFTCTFGDDEDLWTIENVATVPAYRGRGLAGRMIQEVLPEGRRQGLSQAQRAYPVFVAI